MHRPASERNQIAHAIVAVLQREGELPRKELRQRVCSLLHTKASLHVSKAKYQHAFDYVSGSVFHLVARDRSTSVCRLTTKGQVVHVWHPED